MKDTSKIGNYMEQHRLECEARHLMQFSPAEREVRFKLRREKRGDKAIDALVAEVQRQFRLKDEQTSEMEM